jgi:hypothetical protein
LLAIPSHRIEAVRGPDLVATTVAAAAGAVDVGLAIAELSPVNVIE